jgi:hypothetical protein
MDRAKVVVEQRGSHFVAWAADEAGKPRGTVLMVGRTAEEAEARLSAWWAEAGNREP